MNVANNDCISVYHIKKQYTYNMNNNMNIIIYIYYIKQWPLLYQTMDPQLCEVVIY